MTKKVDWHTNNQIDEQIHKQINYKINKQMKWMLSYQKQFAWQLKKVSLTIEFKRDHIIEDYISISIS